MRRFWEMLKKAFEAPPSNYALRIDADSKDKRLVISQYRDWAQNGFPYWMVIERDERVVKALAAEAKKHDLTFDHDGLLRFNEEMKILMDHLRSALEQRQGEEVAAAGQKALDDLLAKK